MPGVTHVARAVYHHAMVIAGDPIAADADCDRYMRRARRLVVDDVAVTFAEVDKAGSGTIDSQRVLVSAGVNRSHGLKPTGRQTRHVRHGEDDAVAEFGFVAVVVLGVVEWQDELHRLAGVVRNGLAVVFDRYHELQRVKTAKVLHLDFVIDFEEPASRIAIHAHAEIVDIDVVCRRHESGSA